MTARCTKCNSYGEFRNKKGNKLSNMTCSCGGKFELLTAVDTGLDTVFFSRSDVRYRLDIGNGSMASWKFQSV